MDPNEAGVNYRSLRCLRDGRDLALPVEPPPVVRALECQMIAHERNRFETALREPTARS